MRHGWLAVCVLGVASTIGGDAVAKHVACDCPAVLTLPERGATNVPTNAKLWSFGSPGPHIYRAHDGAEIPNVQVEAPVLQPNQPYKNDGWMMDFTTGAGPDDVAPTAPTDLYASVATLIGGDVEALSISARLPTDTALVRIDLRDASGAIARLVTTPRRLFLCQPGLRITPGKVFVEIRALDLAGNESPPLGAEITSTTLASNDPALDCMHGGDAHEHHRHRHGHGFEILFFVILVPITLIVWVVAVIVRRIFVKRHLAESISLLEAEALARRLIRWQAVWSAMLVGTAVAMQFARDINDLWILLAPFIFSSVGQLFLQQRALRLLDRPEADAVRRGPWLVVTTLHSSITVRASDADFVAAKRSSIPKSVAK
ncbi:MAG TPA: hypothetical protein VIV11_43280 [Kofleriaceae bacterium]